MVNTVCIHVSARCVHATALYGAETLVVSPPYVVVVTRPLPSLSRSRWLCESESRRVSLSLFFCPPPSQYLASIHMYVLSFAILLRLRDRDFLLLFSLFLSLRPVWSFVCLVILRHCCLIFFSVLLLFFSPYPPRVSVVQLRWGNVYIRESMYSLYRSDDHD